MMLSDLRQGRERVGVKSILAGLCLVVLGASACGDELAGPVRLITLARSFVTDGRESIVEQRPIVVFVSQHGCPYCEVLRDQVLFPMAGSGQLQENAVFRELSLDLGFVVTDFDGEDISGRKFADRYGASVTPTLLFLDSEGSEIAGKLVGISNVEYYSYYYAKALKSATAALDSL